MFIIVESGVIYRKVLIKKFQKISKQITEIEYENFNCGQVFE